MTGAGAPEGAGRPVVWERVHRAAEAVRARSGGFRPEIAIILGSGLGGLADEIRARAAIPYAEIPHFPVPSAEGHRGRLILGELEGRAVAALQGRAHLYEGHAAADVALPVRALAALGAQTLLVTNAAGALNPAFLPGDLMLIEDHINLTGANPLVGPPDESLDPRFPDMSRAYDPELRDAALAAAHAEGISVRRGVYVAVLGPSYETPAEIAMLAGWGADAVGMSTVTEVIAARHRNLRVLGIAAITNAPNVPGTARPTAHSDVLEVTAKLGPRFVRLARRILRTLPPAGRGR